MKIKRKNRKIIYPFLFFLGLGLIIWQIEIFRNTIIDLLIPIGIILSVGIIAFIFDYKNYKKTYKKSGTGGYFYAAMQYLLSYGFIVCSIFMLTNYYLADKNSQTKSYEIVDRNWIQGGTRYRTGQKQPVFTIEYEGKRKELVFYSKFYEKMDSYKAVEFETRKGFFGFQIIENKILKKSNGEK